MFLSTVSGILAAVLSLTPGTMFHDKPVLREALADPPAVAHVVDDTPARVEAAAAPVAAPRPPGGPWRAGTSTWYARGLRNPGAFTAASREFPRGSTLEVCSGPRCIRVLVNDYGPQAWTGHELDLSRGAFAALAPVSRGVIPIRYRKL